MSRRGDADRARIRIEVAREVVSELVSDLKSQHDLFRSLFYPLLISSIVVFIALLFSYSGNILIVLWVMFLGSVVGGRIEIAVPVYATISILMLFQFFGYGSTETIVLASESVGEWLQQCNIGRVKHELCEGFSLSEKAVNTRCLESGAEVYTAGELKSVRIRCKCSSSDKKYIKCECGYKPPESRFRRVKLKVYLILDISVREQPENAQSAQRAIHLLTLTLESSPLRLFVGFFEDVVWYLRVKLCKRICGGIIKTGEFEEVSPWFELKEDLFLVLQDTLRKLEVCHLYVVHAV